MKGQDCDPAKCSENDEAEADAQKDKTRREENVLTPAGELTLKANRNNLRVSRGLMPFSFVLSVCGRTNEKWNTAT